MQATFTPISVENTVLELKRKMWLKLDPRFPVSIRIMAYLIEIKSYSTNRHALFTSETLVHGKNYAVYTVVGWVGNLHFQLNFQIMTRITLCKLMRITSLGNITHCRFYVDGKIAQFIVIEELNITSNRVIVVWFLAIGRWWQTTLGSLMSFPVIFEHVDSHNIQLWNIVTADWLPKFKSTTFWLVS